MAPPVQSLPGEGDGSTEFIVIKPQGTGPGDRRRGEPVGLLSESQMKPPGSARYHPAHARPRRHRPPSPAWLESIGVHRERRHRNARGAPARPRSGPHRPVQRTGRRSTTARHACWRGRWGWTWRTGDGTKPGTAHAAQGVPAGELAGFRMRPRTTSAAAAADRRWRSTEPNGCVRNTTARRLATRRGEGVAATRYNPARGGPAPTSRRCLLGRRPHDCRGRYPQVSHPPAPAHGPLAAAGTHGRGSPRLPGPAAETARLRFHHNDAGSASTVPSSQCGIETMSWCGYLSPSGVFSPRASPDSRTPARRSEIPSAGCVRGSARRGAS